MAFSPRLATVYQVIDQIDIVHVRLRLKYTAFEKLALRLFMRIGQQFVAA